MRPTRGRSCQLRDEVKMTSTLHDRFQRGVLWRQLPNDDISNIVEVGSVMFKGTSWSKRRRVVLVRVRPAYEPQLKLFIEYSWRYEAIVTDLNWEPEDIWHFYNQRCSCENYIKELKYGVNIDAISKTDLLPNAADLWLKVIAYNALLGLRGIVPAPYQCYSTTGSGEHFCMFRGSGAPCAAMGLVSTCILATCFSLEHNPISPVNGLRRCSLGRL